MIRGSSNRALFLRRVEDELRRQDARATTSLPPRNSPPAISTGAAATPPVEEPVNRPCRERDEDGYLCSESEGHAGDHVFDVGPVDPGGER
jgi:hypothetical protein